MAPPSPVGPPATVAKIEGSEIGGRRGELLLGNMGIVAMEAEGGSQPGKSWAGAERCAPPPSAELGGGAAESPNATGKSAVGGR